MKNYLTRLIAFTLLLAALVAGLAVVVDPYDYWGMPTMAGVNAHRPASGKHLAVVKQRQYARQPFNAIVAGNSRVGVGIDPADPAWPTAVQPVYNLGLPGKRMSGVVEEIIKASDIRKPRVIYVGIDFIDFRLTPERWSQGPPPDAPVPATWRKWLEVALSLDALNDSVLSLAAQRDEKTPHILPNGFNNLAEYDDLVAQDGHFLLFEQRNRENVGKYVTGPKAVSYPGSGRNDAWAALDQLATYAKSQGIRLVLFTYPYHAELRLSLHVAGLDPAYAEWLAQLANFGARNHVPVYYFSVLSSETQETVPVESDRTTQLRYYWEAGHFKAALGHLMIADMVSATAPRFGRRLLPADVAPLLAADARALRAFEQAQPERAARIRKAAAMARAAQ